MEDTEISKPSEVQMLKAIGDVEARMHDVGSHALAAVVAWAVIDSRLPFSHSLHVRAENILRAVRGTV